MAASPRPVVLQQILNTSQGQRFLLVGAGGAKMAVMASPGTAVSSQGVTLVGGVPQQGIIFSNASNTVTTTVASSPAAMNVLSTTSALHPDGSDEFKVTPDYIQKAISDALKSQNLSPEIEQKLLALQHHTIEKGLNSTAAKKAAAPIDPLSGEPMDDEWEPTSRPRSGAGGRKRKSATTAAAPPSPEASETSVPKMASPPPTPVAPAPKAPATPPRSRSKSGQRSGGQANPVIGGSNPALDEKRRQQAVNKLQQMLARHKEQLKKDIARKRSLQEKELQIEIHREIEKAKMEQQVIFRDQFCA
jgi:hypothetical protein